MASSDLNPMGDLYQQFLKILNNVTVKFTYKAVEYDTVEVKQYADRYLDAYLGRDTFYTYVDYTEEELNEVHIFSTKIVTEALKGNIEAIPHKYRDKLLVNRRNKIIKEFEEKNDYYRTFHGLPPRNTKSKDFIYLGSREKEFTGLDGRVPLHLIQDTYNELESGKGDYYMALLEGTNFINDLIEKNPDKEYLKYLGSNRISIYDLRRAKNFQIIQLKGNDLSVTMFQQFTETYEKCREYFVKVLYNSAFRSIIPFYDNLIGVCIMAMTFNTLVMKQIPLGIRRDFYDKYAIKALYEAYNVPYNIFIDEETQSNIIQNLNLLIQHKATDKVLYDIASILGFSNVNIYKYYLMKNRKTDRYGVPIVGWKERFNNDTGDFDVIPDYENMYDVFFQKEELRNQDFVNSFNHSENRVDYKKITQDDPFWWEDSNVYNMRYETEYNFVESKYLSLGVSYSMTDLVFDSTILLKLLLSQKDTIGDVMIKLPRITKDEVPVSIFDVIILLICLTSTKHNLAGEIITLPTQVISVIDYIENVEDSELLVDTLSFNFQYFSPRNRDWKELDKELQSFLSEDEYKELLSYLEVLAIDNELAATDKIKLLNQMYTNVKGLYKFIEHKMDTVESHYEYTCLRRLYKSAFYSKQMANIFTITTNSLELKRLATNYYEFLYYTNPKLYNAVFEYNPNIEYVKYLDENHLKVDDMDFDEYLAKVELGEIEVDFSVMRDVMVENHNVKDEKIYYYVNHIISRLDEVIDDLDYSNLLRDVSAPMEELLLRLVRFFKSYTVDILGLDHVYICDFKPENLIKLLDEIDYMLKVDQVNSYFKLNHSDVVNTVSVDYWVKQYFKIKDKFKFESNLTIPNLNPFIFRDMINGEIKTIEIDRLLSLYDTYANITAEQSLDDKISLKEKYFIQYEE